VEKVVQPAPLPVQEPPKVAEKPVTKPEPVVESKPEPAPTEKSPAKQGGVSVQIGVFTPSPKVEQIQAKVSGLGFNCGTEPMTANNGSKLLRMRCGPFTSREEAQKAQQKLKAAGYNNSILVAH
jgi:cell division septation protein DedD